MVNNDHDNITTPKGKVGKKEKRVIVMKGGV